MLGPALQRADAERLAGLPSPARGHRTGPACPRRAEEFFEVVARWHYGKGAGFNGRARRPLDLPDTLHDDLRKLAAAIGQGVDDVDEPEDRVELAGLQARCLGLADQVLSWTRQAGEDQVYWVEVEETISSPHPAGRGAAGRRRDPAPQLFDKVKTCILTSATLCVGTPPKFRLPEVPAGPDLGRDPRSWGARSTTPTR